LSRNRSAIVSENINMSLLLNEVDLLFFHEVCKIAVHEHLHHR